MTVILLTHYREHDPRIDSITFGTRVKPLSGAFGVIDVLAWCSRNECQATMVETRDASVARVFVINPLDDDAAIAFVMRWR